MSAALTVIMVVAFLLHLIGAVRAGAKRDYGTETRLIAWAILLMLALHIISP